MIRIYRILVKFLILNNFTVNQLKLLSCIFDKSDHGSLKELEKPDTAKSYKVKACFGYLELTTVAHVN